MPRILYFVASHTNPEQVVRLVRTLCSGNPDSQVVVHHNYSVSYLNPAAFTGMSNVHLVQPHVRVEWGGFSQIAMVLRFMDWALTHPPFDWAVLLSGQDYPIVPVQQIEQFLDNTEYDGFVSAHRVDEGFGEEQVFPEWYFYHWYFYRIYKLPMSQRWYRAICALRGTAGSRLSSAAPVRDVASSIRPPLIRVKYSRPAKKLLIGFRRLATPFHENFHCYHGSSWWTLSRRAVEYVRDFVHSHPDFVRYYKRAHLPEESFFLTILMNSPELRIFSDNKRYIRWAVKPAPHPDILTARDFEHIVSSGKHFARKVNQNVDVRLLDMLDKHIRACA